MVSTIFVLLDIKTRARRDEALSLSQFCPLVVRNTLDKVDPRKEKWPQRVRFHFAASSSMNRNCCSSTFHDEPEAHTAHVTVHAWKGPAGAWSIREKRWQIVGIPPKCSVTAWKLIYHAIGCGFIVHTHTHTHTQHKQWRWALTCVCSTWLWGPWADLHRSLLASPCSLRWAGKAGKGSEVSIEAAASQKRKSWPERAWICVTDATPPLDNTPQNVGKVLIERWQGNFILQKDTEIKPENCSKLSQPPYSFLWREQNVYKFN